MIDEKSEETRKTLMRVVSLAEDICRTIKQGGLYWQGIKASDGKIKKKKKVEDVCGTFWWRDLVFAVKFHDMEVTVKKLDLKRFTMIR